MENVILCGEQSGFWNVEPNDILVLTYDENHNYMLQSKSGLTLVKGIACNEKKEILDDYLRNGDHFTVEEVRGKAIRARMNACKKIAHNTEWDA